MGASSAILFCLCFSSSILCAARLFSVSRSPNILPIQSLLIGSHSRTSQRRKSIALEYVTNADKSSAGAERSSAVFIVISVGVGLALPSSEPAETRGRQAIPLQRDGCRRIGPVSSVLN
ncbi:exported hypothetical protein [Acidobacteriia bacterium SbA2]|nr:exported hypothetical protein [Acidobacteriia bacterium SbA2]